MMGSLALIMMSVFFEAFIHKRVTGMLKFFGRHSLFIMITHMNFMILYFAEKLAFVISDVIPRGKGIVFNVTATVFTMMVETVCILIWEKIKESGVFHKT